MSKYISGIKGTTFNLDITGSASTSTTTALTYNTAGVYVGVNSNGNATVQINAPSATAQSYVNFTRVGINYSGRVLYDHSLSEMQISTVSTSPAVYINSSGNMGIGARSTTYKLETTGDICARSANLHTTGATGWTNDTYNGGWYMNDTSAVRVLNDKNIASAGNLFIGNITSSAITAAGIITANSGLSVTSGTFATTVAVLCGAGTSSGNGNIHYALQTSNVIRFALALSGTETGSNTGSNLSLLYYNDTGTILGSVLTFSRATGAATFIGAVSTGNLSTGSITTNGQTINSGTINSLDIIIPSGKSLYSQDINSLTSQVAVGYYTPKTTNGSNIFLVYNNSTDRIALFSVTSVGSSSGSNAINVFTTFNTNGNTINSGNISCGNINSGGISCGSLTTNGNTINCGSISCGSLTTNGNTINSGSISCTSLTTNGNTLNCGTINSGSISCSSINTNGNTLNCGTINSGDINISSGKSLYSADINSTSSQINVGYYTPKTTNGANTLQVYNNSTDRIVLFSVTSVGTSSGSNSVNVTATFNTSGTATFNSVLNVVGTINASSISCRDINTNGSTITSGNISCGTINTSGTATINSSLNVTGTINASSISCRDINTNGSNITTNNISASTINNNTLNANIVNTNVIQNAGVTNSYGITNNGNINTTTLTATNSITITNATTNNTSLTTYVNGADNSGGISCGPINTNNCNITIRYLYCQVIYASGTIYATGSGSTQLYSSAKAYLNANGVTVASTGLSGTFSAEFSNNIMVQTTVYINSDIRIKKDIEPILDEDVILNGLKPSTYNYIDPTKNLKGRKRHGLIAQEVEDIFPDAVTTSENAIPNIMKAAEIISEYEFKLDEDIPIGKIRIFTNDNQSGKEIQVDCNITSRDGDVYTIDKKIDKYAFIYGTFVNDFKCVE